jgi:hypothetical protein
MATVPSGSAVLNGWIDFNADGDWDDTGEQVLTNQAIVNGLNTPSISVPVGATVGNPYARFRLTNTADYSYGGFAPDGEVEDYQVTIVAASAGGSASIATIDDEESDDEEDEVGIDFEEQSIDYPRIVADDQNDEDLGYGWLENESESRTDEELSLTSNSLDEDGVDAVLVESEIWTDFS